MSIAQIALEQIVVARGYTLRFLSDLADEDWFRQPAEGVTHIAWQVGHLAMAQYRLTLERLRGVRPEDAQLISETVLTLCGKGSTPLADRAAYPPPQELLATLARVHEQALAEVPQFTDGDLEAPPLKPHPLFNTKRESLFWCARHEMVHTGQIGLLRRLFGKPPKW